MKPHPTSQRPPASRTSSGLPPSSQVSGLIPGLARPAPVPVGGGSGLGAWLRCRLASRSPNASEPGVFICKEGTVPPTHEVVCGIKHLGNCLE